METLKSGCSPRVRAPTRQQCDLTLRYPCACTHQAHSHASRPCPHCPSTPTAHLPEAFDAQWTTRTLPTSLPFVRLYIHFLVSRLLLRAPFAGSKGRLLWTGPVCLVFQVSILPGRAGALAREGTFVPGSFIPQLCSQLSTKECPLQGHLWFLRGQGPTRGNGRVGGANGGSVLWGQHVV